jgi:hypothetical protein
MNIEINCIQLQKMTFLYNAIESGWEIRKNEDKYTFRKKHEGKKEVFTDAYLRDFIKTNLELTSS